MLSAKRLLIATILGFLCGLLSWVGARSVAPEAIPWSGVLAIVLSRTVLGFAIGLSAWRVAWWLHGLLLGLIFSLPAAFGGLWVGMGWYPGFVGPLVGGLIIGFLIELITSVGFKARAAGRELGLQDSSRAGATGGGYGEP